MSNLLPPSNPVELAEARVERLGMSDGFGITEGEQQLLAELDHAANVLGFLRETYFIETGRAMIIPVTFEADQPLTHFSFSSLCFEGLLACYSKVQIGRLVGHGSVRAICLTFSDATLLPYFDSLGPDQLLHVPVLAVETIDKTAA